MHQHECERCGLVMKSLSIRDCIRAHEHHCRPKCMVCCRTVSRIESCRPLDNMYLGLAHKACIEANLDLDENHPNRVVWLQYN